MAEPTCNWGMSEKITRMARNDNSMGKYDRARLILEYMAEHDVAMSPNLWFENLKRQRSITFSYHTTRRRIHDFHEHGWVDRFDVDQGIFAINDAGRVALAEGISDEVLDSVIGKSGE